MSDAARAVNRHPRACPTLTTAPWCQHHSCAFDTSPAVHFRSSLRYCPDQFNARPFPISLTTTPLKRSSSGRFGACACTPTPRGPLSSLVQHGCLEESLPTRAFVAHSRLHSGRRRGPGAPVPDPVPSAGCSIAADSGGRLAAFLPSSGSPSLRHHARFQIPADEAMYSPVVNLRREFLHQPKFGSLARLKMVKVQCS